MRRFLEEVFFFLSIPLVYFSVMGFINFQNSKNQKPILKNSRVVFMGDSHMQAALNPEDWQGSINMAQSAEPYVLTYWKLKEFIKFNKVDTVLLSLSYHNLSGFNDLKFSHPRWSAEIFKRSYLMPELKTFNEIPIDYSSFYRMLWKQYCIFPKQNHIYYFGKFTPHKTSNFSWVTSTLKRHFSDNKKTHDISKVNVKYFNKTLALANSNNIELVVICPPINKVYMDGVPQKFITSFNDLVSETKEKGVPVLNYTNLNLEDEYFKDGDHLNLKGSKKLYDEIRKDLKN
jgi:hypothetical protein